jgi:hypothetical protein
MAFALEYSQNAPTGESFLICQQTLERSLPGRRAVAKPTFVGAVTDLIVPDDSAPAPRPQAFLVEQTANWTLPTHFHQEHQFQVFVAGGGTIGRNPVEKLAVHYASPHTGYGPLVSGAKGIAYLTLRAVGDTGAWYLPEQRESLLLRIRKQQAHAVPAASISAPDLKALAEPFQETLIEPQEGGLAAWLVRLPAGGAAPVPARSWRRWPRCSFPVTRRSDCRPAPRAWKRWCCSFRQSPPTPSSRPWRRPPPEPEKGARRRRIQFPP